MLFRSLSWPDEPPKEIGYLAQMTEFDRRFPLRVRDLVAMGAWKGFGLAGRLDRETSAKVTSAMDAAGVFDIADRSLHTLSGGQLQRALFARVSMQDAPLILLDEPFAAVDQTTEAHLLTLIDRWRDEGRAVVLVVHDLSSVLDHCDNVLLLGNGEACHGSVDAILTPATPTAAFGLGEMKDADPVQMYRNDVFAVTVNLAGLPGISVPAGLDKQGLPLGLQLIGKPFEEGELLQFAHTLERAAGFVAKPEKWW